MRRAWRILGTVALVLGLLAAFAAWVLAVILVAIWTGFGAGL